MVNRSVDLHLQFATPLLDSFGLPLRPLVTYLYMQVEREWHRILCAEGIRFLSMKTNYPYTPPGLYNEWTCQRRWRVINPGRDWGIPASVMRQRLQIISSERGCKVTVVMHPDESIEFCYFLRPLRPEPTPRSIGWRPDLAS